MEVSRERLWRTIYLACDMNASLENVCFLDKQQDFVSFLKFCKKKKKTKHR